MTREEAKAVLYEWQKMMVRNGVPIDTSKVQALRVAIEALSKPNYESDTEVRLAVTDRNKDKVILWDAFGEVEYYPNGEINCVHCPHYHETEDDTGVHGHCGSHGRLIDADALIKELEKVLEFLMNETNGAKDNPEKFTSKFIASVAGRMDGIVDAEIEIDNAPTIEPSGGLISREDALRELNGACSNWQDDSKVSEIVSALPSASDLISREDAMEAVADMQDGSGQAYRFVCKALEILSALPTADRQDEDRLYIKIYGDDEPSTKAEKLYQISGSDMEDVTEWVKEYFPTADRPSIVRCGDCKYIDCCTRTVGLTRHFDGFREYRSEIIDFCSYGERREP